LRDEFAKVRALALASIETRGGVAERRRRRFAHCGGAFLVETKPGFGNDFKVIDKVNYVYESMKIVLTW
jgi:hypothetical protein